MRCWLFFPLFTVSVCQSVCHASQIGGGACSVRRVPCARGHSVQPLSNYFDTCCLGPPVFCRHTKFQVSSFSRSGDMRGSQNSNRSHVTPPLPPITYFNFLFRAPRYAKFQVSFSRSWYAVGASRATDRLTDGQTDILTDRHRKHR